MPTWTTLHQFSIGEREIKFYKEMGGQRFRIAEKDEYGVFEKKPCVGSFEAVILQINFIYDAERRESAYRKAMKQQNKT